MAFSFSRLPRPLTERTQAPLLQGALWVLLTGFYWVWLKRPNYYIAGTSWPAVVLYVGFAVILFNSLVYGLIPRWLLRQRYGPALAGGWLLVVAYRYWFYLGAQAALTYLPLTAELRRDLPELGGPTPWVVLTSPLQFLHTLRSLLAAMLLPVLGSFLAYALLVDRRRLALERQHLQLEVSCLKAQLDPGFLFRALGQLDSLTRAGDARAGDVVVHLADMLRYTLYETDAERVPLARELDFTDAYLALARLRYPAATLTHTVAGDPAAAHRITPLLLHPLLEQLLAPLRPPEAFLLRSTLHVTPAGLTWKLSRHTSGSFPPYAAAPAVQATRRRLRLHYPGGHELRITEEPTALRIVLCLTL